jgi:anti-sigma factor RsiW
VSQSAERKQCADVQNRLEALIDDELDAGLVALLEAHIEMCERCREERLEAEAIRAALRALPSFEPPPQVAAAVVAAADDDAASRRHRLVRLPTRPVLTAAAVAVLAALVLAIQPGRQPALPDPTSVEARQAAAETRLAFAVVAGVTRRAEDRVRDRMLAGGAVASTVRDLVQSLKWIHETGGVSAALGAGNPTDSERSS